MLSKTLKPLRARAGVTYVTPARDPNFTDYGYTLTPVMQEIRRERRVELALQGYRLDDLMRWAADKVIVGKRGKGAYLGHDGGYQFNPKRDYLLPIPPSELELNKQMKQNPGWK